jgi:hypothetical protein
MRPRRVKRLNCNFAGGGKITPSTFDGTVQKTISAIAEAWRKNREEGRRRDERRECVRRMLIDLPNAMHPTKRGARRARFKDYRDGLQKWTH